MARLRPVDFEDRLTLVEHLDELRTRIVISLAALAVAFGLCFWQNSRLLEIANEPLPGGFEPITFGVSEPFMTTVTISAYAAIVIALPVILYQAYAFVLPALTKQERRVIVPFLVMVPFLFVAGVVFAYYFVLPNAINFLQNFNDDNYDILLQARDFYRFEIMVLMLMGVLFQVPIGILAVTRVGIVSTTQLRKNRRYVILVIAILAMLLPGQDPVTMLMMMAPLIVLFEGSILLASLLDRRAVRASAREEAELARYDDGDLPSDPDSDRED
jgi:sec-independent protein translocase protein TatC